MLDKLLARLRELQSNPKITYSESTPPPYVSSVYKLEKWVIPMKENDKTVNKTFILESSPYPTNLSVERIDDDGVPVWFGVDERMAPMFIQSIDEALKE